MRKQQLEKGSITVEAAWIVPLSLMVICAVLTLCFHIHNEAWYTAAAGEAIITGSTYAVANEAEGQRVMKHKITQLSGGSGFPDNCPGIMDLSNSEYMEVRSTAHTNMLFGGGVLKMSVSQRIKIIRPVAWIRKKQAAVLIKE